jgi:hypothetical protein
MTTPKPRAQEHAVCVAAPVLIKTGKHFKTLRVAPYETADGCRYDSTSGGNIVHFVKYLSYAPLLATVVREGTSPMEVLLVGCDWALLHSNSYYFICR